MMNVMKFEPAAQPEHRIAAVIEEFGAWRVLRMALQALVRRSGPPFGDARELPEHLRRDIGLSPEIEVPRAWELWR